MRETALRRVVSSISLLQVGIIILTLATAFIHLQLGLSMGGRHAPGFSGKTSPAGFPSGAPPAGFSNGTPPVGFPNGANSAGFSNGAPPAGFSILAALPVSLSTLFILNCIGYIVLVIVLYLPPLRKFQRIIRWLLIIFTAVTIIAWFLIAGSHPTTFAIVDKVVEVALIVLLLIEEWQAFRLKRV